MAILEIGCGEGGNLLPLARFGCNVTGIDISVNRIREARDYFNRIGCNATFICSDILSYDCPDKYDIIICHDILEHICNKKRLLHFITDHLNHGGAVFMAFPVWQMPFGGHQQLCRNRIISHSPFIHLLPDSIYKWLLRMAGETDARIIELLDIKRTRISISTYLNLIGGSELMEVNHRLWFINPHYEVKFGLKPVRTGWLISKFPYFRNYLTTSYWSILKTKQVI